MGLKSCHRRWRLSCRGLTPPTTNLQRSSSPTASRRRPQLCPVRQIRSYFVPDIRLGLSGSFHTDSLRAQIPRRCREHQSSFSFASTPHLTCPRPTPALTLSSSSSFSRLPPSGHDHSWPCTNWFYLRLSHSPTLRSGMSQQSGRPSSTPPDSISFSFDRAWYKIPSSHRPCSQYQDRRRNELCFVAQTRTSSVNSGSAPQRLLPRPNVNPF